MVLFLWPRSLLHGVDEEVKSVSVVVVENNLEHNQEVHTVNVGDPEFDEISEYTKADKINYAIYGDLVSHFHVHLVPKHRDGLQWGGPFTDDLPKVLLADQEYEEISQGLLAHLAPLL